MGGSRYQCDALPRFVPASCVSGFVVAELNQLILSLVCGSLFLIIDVGTSFDTYLGIAVICSTIHSIVSLGATRLSKICLKVYLYPACA